ncbi:hypothetical protein H8B06_15975 [Sphingobacterium sp. DN00404]|uniref:Uncharacterized protein n=2 Tax=Sphingobacterium TaxID=28453 RepID=A0A4Q6XQS3_9SPHI|nr:hypothetical protein [Sphingobacterium micropteri]MBD1434331.1 hypothetical protein [Sphingobacterium micropteri]RZF58546.1 hypothetical protein EWE74_18260 [Sphingobacterium corticibacterium]
MVEFFTKEHDTELSEERVSMVEIVDETFEQNLKSNLQKLVKDPSPKVLENILNYSRSLRK